MTDDEILTRSPIVLALTSPKVNACTELPADAVAPDNAAAEATATDNGVLREALRLRARWLQEVTGRAAWELGKRLTAGGTLPTAESVRHLSFATIEAIATGRAVTSLELTAHHEHSFGERLPACFQLSDLGLPIAARRADEVGGGTGAGGGSGVGPVTHDTSDPPDGAVLVTTTLTPGLGPLLPRLAGIVSETGSVLSHLAILAREAHVPTVVGYAGAASTFDDGAIVNVDGDNGDVSIKESPEEESS